MKIWIVALILTFALMLFNIGVVKLGVENAIYTCIKVIVPSLFVYIFMSNLLVEVILSEPGWNFSPKWLIFIMGSLCGFPVGATVSEKLLSGGLVKKKDAEKIIPFCNNASPAYVIGAIGVSLIGSAKVGVILYISEIFAAFLLLLPIKFDKNEASNITVAINFGGILFDSVEKAIKTILSICGIIVVFSALLSVIHNLNEKLYYISSFLLEISNGVMCCNDLFINVPDINIPVLGFLCGWSGICVQFQIISTLKSIKVKLSQMLLLKFFQGIITMLISYIGYKLFI